ncbi:MAG: hypothetical protein IJW53_00940 [Clostridia bacterium]|nr:hypothetical protein [Clostridia bacterium]
MGRMNKYKQYAIKCLDTIKSDYRHFICIGITLFFLSLIPWLFNIQHLRIWESLIDVKNSAIFYVSELFELNLSGQLTVLEFTKTPLTMPLNLPNTWEEFTLLWGQYWDLFITEENFNKYTMWLSDILYYSSKFLVIVMPIFMVIYMAMQFKSADGNNNYNEDSKALKKWRRFEKKVYVPIKNWVKGFIGFVKENPYYYKAWLWIWAYNFNIIAIVIEFIAYYLYIISSMEFVTLYIQVLKLLMDLSTMIDFFPGIVWFTFGLIVTHIIRTKIGYNRLEHYEHKDRGFVNERSIVIMLYGTMGSKKTTIVTDISISQEIMFRDKAFELILENDMMFPFFPYINLENELKKAMDNHSVYNLATARRFAKSKRRKWEKHPHRRNIFGYDYERYGTEYNNNLFVKNIWEMIESYSQLYFIYVIQSSLLISNYSIRVDNTIEDLGNFPIWNTDLFRRDARYQEAYSRHAHILDFDMLRLGKKVIDENEKANVFEFGVIDITEIGKERGNTLENKETKKNDAFANQKNDLFNSWLKMVRHSATVDNFPFVRVLTDDQRPASWGADARDLAEIVFVEKVSKMSLAMPLFALEDLVITWLLEKHKESYYQYRYERGDNTLRMYLAHGLMAFLHRYHKRIYNTFGYYKIKAVVESGRQDGDKHEGKYYLMSKKIYSKRFSTDCFSDFFNEKALRSNLGIDDLPEFEKTKASFEEMMSMNSYFFFDLNQLRDKDSIDN